MKFAFIFPGQGSQSVGMMRGYADFAVVEDTFVEASDILKQDFWAMANDGPAETLALTVNTQPLMLIAGIAVYRVWLAAGGRPPDYMAGHSLAEYTALVASGAIAFADALPLVRLRAEAMQDAVPIGAGGMAAILGLDDEAICQVCCDAADEAKGEPLEPANFNSPGQVVIAGHKNAIERGIALAKERGAKRAVLLAMSVPSHCSMMSPAAEKLWGYLQDIEVRPPAVPVLHNYNVLAYNDPVTIKAALVKQLTSPVRWVDTIRALAAAGTTHVVECGPGKVLAGLNKRIDANLESAALIDAESIKQTVTILG